MPSAERSRDWLRNVQADPRIVTHLEHGATADLPATARVITDPDEPRPLIEAAARCWGRTDVPAMVEHSPLIDVQVDDDATPPR